MSSSKSPIIDTKQDSTIAGKPVADARVINESATEIKKVTVQSAPTKIQQSSNSKPAIKPKSTSNQIAGQQTIKEEQVRTSTANTSMSRQTLAVNESTSTGLVNNNKIVPQSVNKLTSTTQLKPVAASPTKAESTVYPGGQRVVQTPNGTLIIETDKDVYVNTVENITEQKYINNISGGGLQVGEITGSSFSSLVNNATKLGFDTDSGFEVTDLGSGLAKIGMNSTFKCWEVDGNPGLIACGLDTVNFVAGSGVTITSCNTAVPKTLTISASGGGGTPGGSTGQVQYNNGGSFSGASGLTYNNSTGAVGMTIVEVPSDQSFTINTTSTGPASWYTFYGDLGTNIDDEYSSHATYDDLGNIYMIGANGSSGTPFIVKFNKNGGLVWQKQFNEPTTYYKTGDSIAYFDNHVYCVIGTDDTLDSITVFKISCLTGDIVWQNSLESSTAYVAGSGISIDVDNSGNIYVAGFYDDDVLGDRQILIRLNTSGTLVYQVTLTAGGGTAGYINGMALDQSSWPSSVDVVTLGEYYGNQAFLVKYSGVSGAVIWQKKLENPAGPIPTHNGSQVDVDTLGNIYVTGECHDGSLNKYLYLTKFDSSGNIIWQRNINYPGNFEGLAGVKFYGTHVYIAGYHMASILSGGEPSGYIVLKFDGNSGNLIWQRIFIGSNLIENYYWYWGAKMIDANSSTYIVNGWTRSPGSDDNAFLFQMPVDGSGIGVYGIFTYSESTAIITNSPSLVVSGTSEVESVGTLVSNPQFFTLSNASNTSNLTKISGGSNTVTLGSNGLLSPGNYCLPLSYGVSGSVLTSNGDGQTYFDEPKIYLNSQTNSLRISTINDQVPVFGCYNFALGYESLKCNVACYNISIGSFSLKNNRTGFDNVAVGFQSLFNNLGGSNNIGIGSNTLINNQTGYINVAIGTNVLQNNIGGAGNVGIGFDTLKSNCGASFDNIAIGNNSMYCHVHGSQNVALGYETLRCHVSGSNNYAIGYHALFCNVTGCDNLAIGFDAQATNIGGYENISLGSRSLYSNTTGIRNIAIGTYPMYRNTGGQDNIAMGIAVLECNTIGSYNIGLGHAALQSTVQVSQLLAIGESALRSNTTGCNNIAVGSNALRCNTTGYGNTAIGSQALYCNSRGYENTAVGYRALCANSIGYYQVAVGNYSLLNSICGSHNVAMGVSALGCNVSGGSNIAVGNFALYCNLGSSCNVAIGYQALYNNRNVAALGAAAGGNTAVGHRALACNTTGCYNTGVGLGVFQDVTTGSYNTAIGVSAGYCVSDGSNNTLIGYNAAPATPSSSNTITLGNSSIACIRSQVTTISALSDQRDKTNVEDLPLGLQFILDLRPVKFTWNMRDGAKVGVEDSGFIAQEVAALEDQFGVTQWLDMVGRENPEKLELKPAKLIPILVKAIQELTQEVRDLKIKNGLL